MAQTIIKHVKGNVITLAIPLTKIVRTLVNGVETDMEEDFYPSPDYPVNVVLTGSYNRYSFVGQVEGNLVTITDSKGELETGEYNYTLTCHDTDGKPCRYMKENALKIVSATADAGIVAGVEFDATTYTIEGTVFFYAKGDKGDKGDKGEQGIQGIQGVQGEKGDPFTFEDFTPAQIALLQKPALDAAHVVDETLAHYISPEPITDITDIL